MNEQQKRELVAYMTNPDNARAIALTAMLVLGAVALLAAIAQNAFYALGDAAGGIGHGAALLGGWK